MFDFSKDLYTDYSYLYLTLPYIRYLFTLIIIFTCQPIIWFCNLYLVLYFVYLLFLNIYCTHRPITLFCKDNINSKFKHVTWIIFNTCICFILSGACLNIFMIYRLVLFVCGSIPYG